MKFNEMFPSKFLKAEDVVGEDLVYTIKAVNMEEIGQDKDLRPILSFREIDKRLVVNKTNGRILVKLFGDDSDDWTGKKVAMVVEAVPFQGKIVDSIRLRRAIGNPAPTTKSEKDDLPF